MTCLPIPVEFLIVSVVPGLWIMAYNTLRGGGGRVAGAEYQSVTLTGTSQSLPGGGRVVTLPPSSGGPHGPRIISQSPWSRSVSHHPGGGGLSPVRHRPGAPGGIPADLAGEAEIDDHLHVGDRDRRLRDVRREDHLRHGSAGCRRSCSVGDVTCNL